MSGRWRDSWPIRSSRLKCRSSQGKLNYCSGKQVMIRTGQSWDLTMDGFSVDNRKDFVEDHSPRAHAKWEAAIEELEAAGFIKDRGRREVVFGLTQQGMTFQMP